jgi:hypothetical protein
MKVEGVDWIQLDQGKDQRFVTVDSVTNFQDSIETDVFFYLRYW